MKITPLRSRRKLVTVERKRISSYYTPEEEIEIKSAASALKTSISAFLANAGLKEARRINSEQKKKKQ